MESVKMSSFTVLFVGVALLLFTFYSAYQFLQTVGEVFTVGGDFTQIFGEVLGPLVLTCIRAIYLGIMGWIGSILTRRGVQTLTTGKEETKPKKIKGLKTLEGAQGTAQIEKPREASGQRRD